MKKSILMLLSLFMLGACSLASDDSLFLEEVAGRTITLEGTSYTFSSDGEVLYSSVLTFEFESASSYTEAKYKIDLNGATHYITIKIEDNMISVKDIEKPLFLYAVSEKSVKIDGFTLTFSIDGLTTHNNNPAYFYTFKSITSSTVAKYYNGSYTYIISIDSDGNISAELSDSTTNKEFLDFVKNLVASLAKEDKKLNVDDYLMSTDGEYIYDTENIVVYFLFVSATSISTNNDVITATATYQAMVDGVYLTDVTVKVDSDDASITYYGYDEAAFLKAAFQEQVKGKSISKDGVVYGFTADGGSIIYGDTPTIVSINNITSAYCAKYTNDDASVQLTVKITGADIDIDIEEPQQQGSV